jgi:hypothetical protein
MNRTSVVRRGVGSVAGKARRKAKFAQGVNLPLPHLYRPAEAGDAAWVPERGELFNLKAKPGYYNAEAKAALLRREKTGPHDELLVDFSGDEVRIELVAAGKVLARGDWSWRATVDGTALAAAGAWSEMCWHREDACDYLEIELPLAGGWKIERQMLLARKERFLFVADALLGPGTAGDLAYEQGLALSAGVDCRATQDTREVVVCEGGRARALAAPLACGEWRAELSDGGLVAEGGRMVLAAPGRGRRLYAPLFLDLDARRLARPMTWRRLSVGENLAICRPDAAVGYRVQAGKEQWVFSRSLTEFGNRSVLGHNTAYSFVCGRVKKDGELQPILEIE